jgi:hypothetical protein
MFSLSSFYFCFVLVSCLIHAVCVCSCVMEYQCESEDSLSLYYLSLSLVYVFLFCFSFLNDFNCFILGLVVQLPFFPPLGLVNLF